MAELDLDFVRSLFLHFPNPRCKALRTSKTPAAPMPAGRRSNASTVTIARPGCSPITILPLRGKRGRQMDSARSRMAAWLNVATEEVQFGPSTSQNTYVIAQALRQHLKPGDEVVVPTRTMKPISAPGGRWSRRHRGARMED